MAWVLVVALWGSSWAQTYDFQNFTVEQGLSQSQILCLYQINTGELWMGTNQGGINRYNGSGFSYTTKEHGLSDNVVYSLAQLQDGRVLAGTNNGLSIILADKIDTLTTASGLPHNGVVSILISKHGTIWLGTGKGVAQLVNDTVVPFAVDETLSASTIINMREAEDGTIWFCTVQNGLFGWNGTRLVNYSVKNGLAHNYVFDYMPLGKNDGWVFGYKGLYELNGNAVNDIGPKHLVPMNATYYGYLRDKADNIWIGTSVGVVKHHRGVFQKILTKNNGLVDGNIWKIVQDREGNIWFGSKSTGVSKLNSERFKIYKSEELLPQQTVNAVTRDHLGRLWLGTKMGLAIWQGDSATFIDQQGGLISENVRDFDEQGQAMFIATNYGLTVYDQNGLTSYTAEENDMNSIQDVTVDGNVIWLGTDKGPAQFKDGKIVGVSEAKAFTAKVFDAQRSGSYMWFAYDEGVLRFDGNSFVQFTAKDGFFDGRCRSIMQGPDGNLWFGTNDGVYMYDGQRCTNYGMKDGLISDAVYSLGFGLDGSLWVGQAKGLSRLIFKDGKLADVIRYGKDQGFLGLECSSNSLYMEPDGRIWVGTTYGLVEYDPSEDKGAYFKPITRLTAIKLFSRPTDWLMFSDSVSTEGIPLSLTLPYDKNDLSFEYSGVSLTSPASINYSYMLEGYDADWSEITNRSEARYTSLAPGTYTFMVRAGFGDELWQNEPISYTFTIEPPFYRTTWFYLMLAAIFSAIAYSYYAIRRANTRITLANEQITVQKQEIELQKEVIEKKNREMIDSINYASNIQSAILPSDELWHQLLPDSFVLYRPKDIVSGDFYWLGTNATGDVFFSAVDCTGHGVPGALMSIVGYNGLNQALNEHGLNEPGEILDYLSTSVNESLRKSEHDNYVRDGMDISLGRLNRKSMKLAFAGAYNPLLLIRNGQEMLLKGDRMAIGNREANAKPFTNHVLDVQPGDCIYVYSDGYADQFGGAFGKKMKTAVMRQKVLEYSRLPMTEQKRQLEKFLKEWQGRHEQVDDICVIGIRIQA